MDQRKRCERQEPADAIDRRGDRRILLPLSGGPTPMRMTVLPRLRSRLRMMSRFPWSPRHNEALGLALLCTVLFFVGLGSRELWASHEARAAQLAAGLAEEPSVVPHLFDGQTELQKPIGFYALAALSGHICGSIDAWSMRLPSACSATLTIFALWGWLHRRGRADAAFLSAIILATSIHYVGLARVARIDMSLTAAVACAMLSVGLRWWFSAGFCLGAALLLKGPIGVVLAGGALSAIRLAGEGADVRLANALLRIALGLLPALLWFVAAHQATDGAFTRSFFWYHCVQRATGGADALAHHPWWYYVRFLADFLPWSPMFLLLLIAWSRTRRSDPEARFGLLWFAAMLLLLSLSRFKRADYLLPAYPGAALCVGCLASRCSPNLTSRCRAWAKRCFLAGVLLSVVGWAIYETQFAPRQGLPRSRAAFAAEVRRQGPTESILLFRVEDHLLAWHLGKPIRTLTAWSDLAAVLANERSCLIVTAPALRDELRSAYPSRQWTTTADLRTILPIKPDRPIVLVRSIDTERDGAWPNETKRPPPSKGSP